MADMTKSIFRWGRRFGGPHRGSCLQLDRLGGAEPVTPVTRSACSATPNDAEALLGTYYKRWSTGSSYGSQTDIEGMASMMSLMNYSSLANNGLNTKTPFTGGANVNSPGNVVKDEQFRLYSYMGEVNSRREHVPSRVDRGGTQARVRMPARRVTRPSLNSCAVLPSATPRSCTTRRRWSPTGQAADDAGKLVGLQGSRRVLVRRLGPRHYVLTKPPSAWRRRFPAPDDVDSIPDVVDEGQLRDAHPLVSCPPFAPTWRARRPNARRWIGSRSSMMPRRASPTIT
jgi:hypothetical protein